MPLVIPPAETAALIEVGAQFYARGWAYATSGNYSLRFSAQPLRLLITASGKDKGRLTPADFTVVDERGVAVDAAFPRPSAETLLHAVAMRQPEIGAVLHTHSVWNTLLSERSAKEGSVALTGYEMLKALEGIATHEATVRLRIFENTQDISALAREVAAVFASNAAELRHGFLIRGHGLYTWGSDLAAARRHAEGLEFLLEVTGRSAFPA